tara:strand:+ start:1306 stop:1446 length:141 start_codon:yes stop_codon:yes gene_type:complete
MKKTCLVSTPENEIIYKDSAGHIGKKGGEFLVKKIIRRNWFNGEEK